MSVELASVLRVAGIVLLILSPALLFGIATLVHRCVRAVRRRIADRRQDPGPWATGPPIEQIAADLRRLLWQHDLFTRSPDVAMWGRRLRDLEVAITYQATQAASALGVPHPDPPLLQGFDEPQLRWLLRALAAEGLALPPAVVLLAPDNGLP